MSEQESCSLLHRLTFRVAHPVDIPTCSLLEPEAVASKSRLQQLQRIQHHAAHFFRCVLLEKPDLSVSLIGYMCATRCLSATEYIASADTNLEDEFQPYRYPTTHEPNGRYLAIHYIVVKEEYRRMGVATAMLKNFVKSVQLYNDELDEEGVNRRRNKIKAKKPDAKIERIVLLSLSSMANLFISSGFRWRVTVKGGSDPLFELESEVGTSPLNNVTSTSLPDSHHQLIEHDCFVVDAFTIPGERESGNPVAVIILQDSPTKLIAAHYNNNQANLFHIEPNGKDAREQLSHLPSEKSVQRSEEILVERAEVWMHSVAKEFNQPAAAFVWPLDVDDKCECILGMEASRQDESSISDDEALHLSLHDENSIGIERGSLSEANYFVSFFTRGGIEVDRCEDATLAAASVLFSRIDPYNVEDDRRTLTFHSRKARVIKSHFISSSFWEERTCSPSPLPQAPPVGTPSKVNPHGFRVAIDCSWRTVEPIPPGLAGQGAALSILRRAFFRAWSVVAHDNQEDDHDTDELAFSLSADHVSFIGVTSEGEGDDLFVELTVEGFDMISRRSFDYDALKHWNGYLKGIIVCCEMPESVETNRKCLSDIDFCSRYFQPKDHIGEEQGSHGSLAPYFGEKLGKKRLLGFRSSDRGGLVECILNERDQIVRIIGTTVTTIMGKALMDF
ncbi:hypothetical protein ACHAXA_001921 [Cyclostephanos tholiformis]|uniref:N-acetyltransferase domain-containing protein n=1 Tax=Cyclostephanos tholiformis TaxID=382380 RepID=A0ABD3R6S5_9STRA